MKTLLFICIIAAISFSKSSFAQISEYGTRNGINGTPKSTLYQDTIPSYVPSTGLVGWYHLYGDANDASTLVNNGSCVVGYEPIWVDDRFGWPQHACGFDGVNDFIYMNNAPFTTYPFTISAWIKMDNLSKSCIVGLGDAGSSVPNRLYFAGSYNNTGKPCIGSWGVYNITANNDANLVETGQWTHIAVVYNNSNCKFYINNVEYTSTFTDEGSYNGGFPLNNTKFNIGKHSGLSSNLFMDGIIDEVGIWNRELTPAEIEGLYYTSINVGFESESATSISVYPNPATDYINIKTESIGDTYEIINGVGQVVNSGEISDENMRIDVSDFTSGFYLVRVNEIVSKIYIEREFVNSVAD